VLYQADPRYSPLGYRFILPSNTQIDTVLNKISENKDTNEYEKLLCKHGIAENSKAVSYEQAIALEYNIVFLNGGILTLSLNQKVPNIFFRGKVMLLNSPLN
jgi:hypothetical protein